jgi:hypothetical protein
MTTMKSTMTRWMIAAAAVAAVAGSAAAQTQTYKAEIPLAFRTGGKVMQPGEYQIVLHANMASASFTLYNVDAKTVDGLVAIRSGRLNKAWQPGVPVLVFECMGGGCMLRQLWNGSDGGAYEFQRPRGLSGEGRIALIPLTVVKSD